ncbi:BTAD domain-containing putative transcriptional regulator [Actinoplanes sp. NPDC048967]|uniref:BTAD domain-containing putative transcriptional regulator n=1 Tax=Actinoplanes sp. NPDC048967 TaxID=3155269 RepID=UPI0033E9666A
MGEHVRRHRAAAGLSQSELAARTGLSVAAVRDLEQGRSRRPRPAAMAALTAVLSPLPPPGDPERSLGSARPVVRVLGPVGVWVDGMEQPIGRSLRRAFLARLALTPDACVSLDELGDLLWGARVPGRARSILQTYASRLRPVLAGLGRSAAELVATGTGYRLAIRDDLLDVSWFRRGLDGAQAGDDLDAYESALALWLGRPCADVPELAQHPLVTALCDEYATATLAYAEAVERAGDTPRALPVLRSAVAVNPWHEYLTARLVVALNAAGRRTEALCAYRDARARLDEDLGVEPGPDLRGAFQAIAGATPARPVPAQLPADLHAFVGRRAELDRLDVVGGSGGPGLVLLRGMAGSGKTALAVHWANRVRRSFPDGQLHADLAGHAPGATPVPAVAVLGCFLDALGVPVGSVPVGLPERAALYRSLLADRRVLVVLDDAASADQVRPLLPGAGRSVALVVSRNHLSSLVATYGVTPLAVGPLCPDDARRLLTVRLGRERAAAAGAVVAGCAGLPLALAIRAARCAVHPGELTGRGGAGLDLFDGGDPTVDLRTAFDASYRSVSPAARRAFRLLGVDESAAVTVADAVRLLDRPAGAVRQSITELLRASLLTEGRAGRFAMHDLLRAYARELAA